MGPHTAQFHEAAIGCNELIYRRNVNFFACAANGFLRRFNGWFFGMKQPKGKQ